MSLSLANGNNILIVDDTPDNLTVLTRMLTDQGYIVRPAINGQVALKAVQKILPDLILLDIMMPGINGYEVCRQLKSDERTCDVPVIFISALDEAIDKVKAFQVGGVDYVTKPFQAEEVVVRVQTHLNLRNMQKRLQDQNARLQQEITERKQAEESLRESEKRLRKLSSAAQDAIIMMDHDGNVSFWNEAAERIFGYTKTEVIGQELQRFLLPSRYYDAYKKGFLRFQKTGEGPVVGKTLELSAVKKDGTEFPIELSLSSVQLQGQWNAIGILRDITGRKQAEELLRKLEKATETTEVGITITDNDGHIVYINPADARMHGYTADELIGQHPNIFAPPEFRENSIFLEEEEVEDFSNWQRERINIRKDGSMFPAKLISNPIKDKKGDPIGKVIICEDITERKQAEEILLKQANLLRGVAGAMTCLLVTADCQSALMKALDILGLATGMDRIYIYENHPHPETGEPVMSQRFKWAQDLFEIQVDNPELQNLSYDDIGLHRWYETLSTYSVISGLIRDFPQSERVILEPAGIISTIVTPIAIHDRFWGFIGFDDCQTERQWREEEESILFAMAGSIGGSVARQEAEAKLISANNELKETLESLKQTQTQLVQSEKMAALGQLIAGVAHEINTPLGAIRSAVGSISKALTQTLEKLPEFLRVLPEEHTNTFSALLKHSLQKDVTITARELRKFRRALVKSLEKYEIAEARKTADILADMGIYEDIQPLLSLLHDPEHLRILRTAYELSGLQESTHIITTATERASKVVFALKTYARYDSSGAMIRADISEGIETVLTLYSNQLKHGVEVIRHYQELQPVLCYPDELNQVWTNLVHNALQSMENKGTLTLDIHQNDAQTVVFITDSGQGIPDDIKAKIFDPFFTTKPAGEGSGLGLDIVRKIIDKHQGQISVESEPGKTTFQVSLPMRSD